MAAAPSQNLSILSDVAKTENSKIIIFLKCHSEQSVIQKNPVPP